MLLRKDNRAFVVKATPATIQERLRELHLPLSILVSPQFHQCFIVLHYCMMVREMPNGQLAIGYLESKPKRKKKK